MRQNLGHSNHHGSDTPTSARAILHHTDQKGPNILTGSVQAVCTVLYLLNLQAMFFCNVQLFNV